MPFALLIEVEELLFDTRLMRATALQMALRDEGVTVAIDTVRAAHAGSTAAMALDALQTLPLDALGRELVLRRTSDAVRRALDESLPSFDASVRDAIAQLSAEFPIGVVTRAGREDAMRLLQHAALDMCARTVQSLGDIAPADHHQVWSVAVSKLLGGEPVAVVPSQLAAGAREAGIRTITVAADEKNPGAALVSLARSRASFSASLSAFAE